MRKTASIEIREQFDDLLQQREAANFGMWVFLGTEMMFFGGLFLAYAIYRFAYPTAFAEASLHLDLIAGSINSFTLLTSSFLFSLAISTFQARRCAVTLVLLSLTLLLGTLFLGIKGFEYCKDWDQGFLPGPAFRFQGRDREHVLLFFVLYFLTTGLHSLHLFIGLIATSLLMVLVAWNWLRPQRDVAIGVFGLYWHFVDFIWFFIFPLFYLLRSG